jgi:hypothetical protein
VPCDGVVKDRIQAWPDRCPLGRIAPFGVTSSTFNATKSQARSLLSTARLNIAGSRVERNGADLSGEPFRSYVRPMARIRGALA